MTMTAIEHAEQTGQIGKVDLTYGYYRQPNGWITVSPVTALEELRYRREGWEPLTIYGRVEMATEYAADHPLEGLFIHGGARELCREQIIESGLHLTPPLVPVCGQTLNQYHRKHNELCWRGAQPVTFPQLGEDVPEGLQCRFCQRSPFPTEAARSQHEGVMHREEKGEIRSGQVIAESMVKGLQGSQPSQPTAEHDYICGKCAAGFDNLAVFGKHVKEHDA